MPPDPFGDLERTAPPPPALKRRVTESLRRDGLLRRPAYATTRPWLLAAALALATAIGFAAGRRPANTLAGTPRYAVLLYEDSTFRGAPSAAAGIAEYTEWARGLASSGQLELGEKLDDDAERVLLGAETRRRDAGESYVSGLFIIRARDLDDAERIARTCPHLRYGGTIAVKPIHST